MKYLFINIFLIKRIKDCIKGTPLAIILSKNKIPHKTHIDIDYNRSFIYTSNDKYLYFSTNQTKAVEAYKDFVMLFIILLENYDDGKTLEILFDEALPLIRKKMKTDFYKQKFVMLKLEGYL